MILTIKREELNRLIPAVATGNQFAAASGDPKKILQRIMVSSIGGVITLLISQSQVASQFYSLWLIIGVLFLLYILWGPIIEAGQINSKLRRYPAAALFDGFVSDVFTKERVEKSHEQANKYGELELVEDRRQWLYIDIEDDDGYLGQLSFPLDKKHQSIRNGSRICCLIFSLNPSFNRIEAISDAWLPDQRLWIGQYPYLLRPAFEEICRRLIGGNIR